MISRPRAASTRIAGRHFPTGVSAAVLAVAFGGGPVILAHVSAGTVVNTGCLAGASTAWFISSVGRA
jgi:hypothetical protein